MSKQSDAKAAQGYQDKPAAHVCMNCTRFASDISLPKWAVTRNSEAAAKGHAIRYLMSEYGREANKRCNLGGFAVKKTATCKQFAPSTSKQPPTNKR
jgi:hypothetical protein